MEDKLLRVIKSILKDQMDWDRQYRSYSVGPNNLVLVSYLDPTRVWPTWSTFSLLPAVVNAAACPRCQQPLGKHNALSRTDNRTAICSSCGTSEAMEDWMANAVLPKSEWLGPLL